MSVYLYELPTTGAVSFADFCVDETDGRIYSTHIAEATQARANLRSILKESKRADSGEKDYLRLVKILDEYLPNLLGIMSCVQSGETSLKSQPSFSWRSTLSANLFNTSPRLDQPTLYADLASSLLTYAFALSNLAHSVVKSLGAYETERGISDADRKAKDEKLNFAVTLLCRASGIFTHIGEKVLVEWDKYNTAWSITSASKPPDLTRELSNALSKMALADAQTLAIRKLLSKSAYDSVISPGPPLPKSHPSPGLIAKLHLECASLYASGRALVKTLGSSKSRDGGEGEVSADLRRNLANEAAFHNALAHKWLGVDSGEQGVDAGGGKAVGYLAWAKKQLEELKDGGKGLSIGKDNKDKKELRKGKVADELEATTTFLKHYKKINDSLTFQPIPAQNDLQASIPAGRLAVAARPFAVPLPAFGPGSAEFVRRQAEALELSEREHQQDAAVSGATSPQSDPDSSYAGAGSYF